MYRLQSLLYHGENKIGNCGVRENIDGKLQLLVYDKAIAINIDPIEKKPFFHVLPGETAYSFGTLGCNFRCANCQNYDISQMFDMKGKADLDKDFYGVLIFLPKK
jgi:hypothetical protein